MKLCTIVDCDGTRWHHGYCRPHGYRFLKYGDPLAIGRYRRGVEIVEDAEALAAAGRTAEEIASQIGVTLHALDMALRRNGAADLSRRLHVSGAAERARARAVPA